MAAFTQALRASLGPQERYDVSFGSYQTLIQKAKAASARFKETAFETAQRLEKFSKAEAVRTLGNLAAGVPDRVAGFAERFVSDAGVKVESLMTNALDAAVDLADVATGEGAADALAELLDGWINRAVQSASNMITQAAAFLNRERQTDAGVEGYYWIAMHDAKTRPEHAALDNGEVYATDEQPLSASESSSGEACAPGEDFGCRCSRSPALTAEQEAQSAEEDQPQEAYGG